VRAAARWAAVLVVGAGMLGLGWALRSALGEHEAGQGAGALEGPVPVEVVAVEHGPIERRRELSGTIEAAAELVIAPKVGGRLERIEVDLADVVRRGQVVAVIDDDELRQAEAEARAELTVARAEATAADKSLEIARRSYDRVASLRSSAVVSEQDLDVMQASKLQAEAAVAVADAQVARAQAMLRAAQVREGYTQVTAEWSEDDSERVVAARYADEGTTVSANAPLLSIVDIDPVVVVVHVAERDYVELSPGQVVRLSTDAHPGESFEGTVDRISPVFREQSRQARVELRVPNPEGRLRPGMFARASTLLERVERATIVPEDALVTRNGGEAVFVLSADRSSVSLRPVRVGIREGGRVAVEGEGIEGMVVTLGQQRLLDGSAVVVPEAAVVPAAVELEKKTEGGAS